MSLKTLSLYMMALLYVIAGVLHFVKPRMYVKIMPPSFPAPLLLVYLSGVAEVLLGVLLLIPATQALAAWGVIALLIAVMPANLSMFQGRHTTFRKIPSWILAARLPLQFVLIAWAWLYT